MIFFAKTTQYFIISWFIYKFFFKFLYFHNPRTNSLICKHKKAVKIHRKKKLENNIINQCSNGVVTKNNKKAYT